MNDQRQRGTRQEGLLPGGAASGPDAPGSAERLASARDELARIYAATDSILENIRAGDNERFLEQVRQSGGE